MADDYLLEQYGITSSSFNEEITRFWTRFNILVGLEIGGFIGVLASSGFLTLNPSIFRLALFTMTFFSLATALIVWRGFMMHEVVLKTLVAFEKKSGGKLEIVQISKEASRLPIGFNQMVAIAIAVIFAVIWIALWFYAEAAGYAFVLPT